MALLQPPDVMDDGGAPGFDPAVIAIDRLMLADLRVDELPRLLLGGEQPDIIVQRRLIAFERQDIVGLLIDDLLSDCALTAHGVDGDDRALDLQHRQ